MMKLQFALVSTLCLTLPFPTVGQVAQGTVFVSAPTGIQEADRRNIVTAIDRAGPGDTIQFAAGTYEVGPIIRVTTPELTLLGHPDGTTLRGGELDLGGGFEAQTHPTDDLGILHLFEGGSTVRGLTFTDSWFGLIVGWHYGLDNDEREPTRHGGFVIEQNEFRNSQNGVRGTSSGTAPSMIRHNVFVDVHLGVSLLGSGFRIENNRFTMSDAPRAQGYGVAVRVGAEHVFGAASDNHILHNTIDGYHTGIGSTTDGGRKASGNVFRGNTIALRMDAEGSTGILLRTRPDRGRAVTQQGGAGTETVPTVIEANHISGAGHAGIQIGADYGDVRLLDNTFEDIRGSAVLRERSREGGV